MNRGLPVVDLAREPEVVILGADQNERSLWGQKCFKNSEGQTTSLHSSLVTSITHFLNRFVPFLGLTIQDFVHLKNTITFNVTLDAAV